MLIICVLLTGTFTVLLLFNTSWFLPDKITLKTVRQSLEKIKAYKFDRAAIK